MGRLVIVLAALLSAAPVMAQSRVVCDEARGTCAVADGARENFTGSRRGTQGTIGNRNFEIDDQSYGQASGQIGGRAISNRESRPSITNGNVGATQSRCYADGNGNTYCQ